MRLRQGTLPQASITIPQGAAPRGTPAAPRATAACRRPASRSLWHYGALISASPDQSRRHLVSPRSLPSLIEPAAVGSFVAHLTPSVGGVHSIASGPGAVTLGDVDALGSSCGSGNRCGAGAAEASPRRGPIPSGHERRGKPRGLRVSNWPTAQNRRSDFRRPTEPAPPRECRSGTRDSRFQRHRRGIASPRC